MAHTRNSEIASEIKGLGKVCTNHLEVSYARP